jgi:hypothetical protein
MAKMPDPDAFPNFCTFINYCRGMNKFHN